MADLDRRNAEQIARYAWKERIEKPTVREQCEYCGEYVPEDDDTHDTLGCRVFRDNGEGESQ